MNCIILFLSLIIWIISSPLHAKPIKGFLVSGYLGAELVTNNHTYINNVNQKDSDQKKNFCFSYGGSIGYLYQPRGKQVFFGAEIFGFIDQSSFSGVLNVTGAAAEGNYSISSRYNYGAGLLVGTQINPKVALYAKGGYGIITFKTSYTNLTNPPEINQSYSKKGKGFIVGAGFLYAIQEHIILGAEYNYHFTDPVVLRSETVPLNGINRGFLYNFGTHHFMFRIGYLF